MNIFHKLALQELIHNRARTLVTVAGVILSSALFAAVASFGVSLLSYLTAGAAAKYGDWHVGFYDVDPAFLQQQEQNPYVERTACFDNIGYAVLDGCQNPDKPYLFLAGFSPETFDALPVTLLSGRLPQKEDEILIPAHAITNGGVSLAAGDVLTLAVGKRLGANGALCQDQPYTYGAERLAAEEEKTYTIVGVCLRPFFEETQAPGYTAITVKQNPSGQKKRSLFVTLKNPFRLRSYLASVSEADPPAGAAAHYSLNDNVLRFLGLSRDRVFTTLLFTTGAIVTAIIMTGSIFLIYNAFHISTNERLRQFGILLSVGATSGQLRRCVLFEGLCLGAAGIPFGLLLGCSGMGLALFVVSGNFQNILYADVPLTLKISPLPLLASAAVSLITILISAYLPARKAARTPVMECIRQTGVVRLEAKTVRTSGFAKRFFGLEAMLALKNFKRNKGRCRSIVLSLALSVILFISVNSFVLTFRQAAEAATVFTTYDIGISLPGMEDDKMAAILEALKTVPGVTQGLSQTQILYDARVRTGELTPSFTKQATEDPADLQLSIQFLDDDAYQEILRDLNLPCEAYIGPKAKLIAIAKMDLPEDNRMHEVSEFENLFLTPEAELTVTPRTNEGAASGQGCDVIFAFFDFVPPDILPSLSQTPSLPYIFQALAPASLRPALTAADTFVSSQGLTFCSASPSRSAAEMETLLQQFGAPAGYTIYNVSQMLDESRNLIFIANVFSYAFIVLISLIAAANVFNTISTNIRLRRRELAMLRSMGMSERSFSKMMVLECAFYGVYALLSGLPLALLCSFLIYKGMYTGGAENVRFQLPWASVFISIGSVLLVILSSMQYAVRKIRRENILEALRDDMN